MTSVSGYDTSYSAIADIHQDLNLGGAGFNQEFEFLTGFSSDPMAERPMRLWQDWYDYVIFNQARPTLREVNASLTNALKNQNQSLPKNSTTNNSALSIYDVISSDSRLSKFKRMIDQTGYGKVHESGITILAPINDQFDEILEYALKFAYLPVARLQSLRYHILNYPIKPWQLQNRVLRLKTDLSNQPVESDWTRGKHILMNKINPGYIPPIAGSFTNGSPGADPYPARADTWFPKQTDEVEVLEAIECSNGWLYKIARPIVFSDLL